jgi:hypothetical protein
MVAGAALSACCFGSGFAKQHDAVGIRAFAHVVHAPAVRGLGIFLVVYEDEEGFESRREPAREYMLFKLRFAAVNFANLERNVADGL